MSTAPLISVIVPCFNSEAYLERCVQSVLGQTRGAFELILVDDGSSDGTPGIISLWQGKDGRIVSFSQANSGASAARNKGLDEAAGEWIMFLDSDDWIEPDMLERMIDVAAADPKIQVVQTRVPNDLKHQTREGHFSGEESVRCLLEGSWWGPVCKLIRSSALEGLRFPDKTISEDYLFNYQLFSRIGHLYYLDSCFYHRQYRRDSLSRISLSDRKFDEIYNVKAVFDSVKETYPEFREMAESHLAGSCLKLLFATLREKAAGKYRTHVDMILGIIRDNYTRFLKNRRIPRNVRFLLAGCLSLPTARATHSLYRLVKNES